jgi:hypothetical protein
VEPSTKVLSIVPLFAATLSLLFYSPYFFLYSFFVLFFKYILGNGRFNSDVNSKYSTIIVFVVTYIIP